MRWRHSFRTAAKVCSGVVVALDAREREKEAMESFARALALNPADEELLVQVAETYCDNGDFDTAEEYLNRAHKRQERIR